MPQNNQGHNLAEFAELFLSLNHPEQQRILSMMSALRLAQSIMDPSYTPQPYPKPKTTKEE